MNAEIKQQLADLANQLVSMSLTLNDYSEACGEYSDKHCELVEFSQMMKDTAEKINNCL